MALFVSNPFFSFHFQMLRKRTNEEPWPDLVDGNGRKKPIGGGGQLEISYGPEIDESPEKKVCGTVSFNYHYH